MNISKTIFTLGTYPSFFFAGWMLRDHIGIGIFLIITNLLIVTGYLMLEDGY